MVKILKHYVLDKDLDNPHILYMPQDMRNEIEMTDEYFKKNYVDKKIKGVPG